MPGPGGTAAPQGLGTVSAYARWGKVCGRVGVCLCRTDAISGGRPMSDSQRQIVKTQRRKRPSALVAAIAALALAVSYAAVAFAEGTITVGSASNATLGERVAV